MSHGDEDKERRNKSQEKRVTTSIECMIDIFSNIVVEDDTMDED